MCIPFVCVCIIQIKNLIYMSSNKTLTATEYVVSLIDGGRKSFNKNKLVLNF